MTYIPINLPELFKELEKEKNSSNVSDVFNEKEAQHEIAKKRLDIAKETIKMVAGLLLLALLIIFISNIDKKGDIISNYVTSLFSIMTLVIGFVAGSSIDKK